MHAMDQVYLVEEADRLLVAEFGPAETCGMRHMSTWLQERGSHANFDLRLTTISNDRYLNG